MQRILNEHCSLLWSRMKRYLFKNILTPSLCLSSRQPLWPCYGSCRCLLHPGYLHPHHPDQQTEPWKQEIHQQRLVSRQTQTTSSGPLTCPRLCQGCLPVSSPLGLSLQTHRVLCAVVDHWLLIGGVRVLFWCPGSWSSHDKQRNNCVNCYIDLKGWLACFESSRASVISCKSSTLCVLFRGLHNWISYLSESVGIWRLSCGPYSGVSRCVFVSPESSSLPTFPTRLLLV